MRPYLTDTHGMPRFFYGGQFWNTPQEIQQLQFNQLRSHLYPRDPYLAAEALESAGQPLPTYLPQRMMFQRWKTPPMRAAWLQNAQSMLQARDQGPQQVQQLEQASGLPPMLPFWDAPAALGADRLPQAAAQDQGPEQIISRGVLPPDRIQLTSSELSQLGEETVAATARGWSAGEAAKLDALHEVQMQVDAANQAVYGGTPEHDPWFLRS